MFQEFSYNVYRQLLELLRQRNECFCFSDLPVANEPARYCLLRHDVDFSPEPALRMANLEAEMGVRSSYFLLLSLDHVNLLSEQYGSFPSRLVELGHEVGLHYDLGALRAIGKDDLIEALLFQCDALSSLTGVPVRSISMHNPSRYGADPFDGIGELINAYDRAYTEDIAYFSDSAGAWRDDFISVFESQNIPPKLQLLVHPYFWAEQDSDRWAKLEHSTMRKIDDVNREARELRELWAQHPGVVEHDRRNESR